MVNTVALKDAINESGIKHTAIAEKAGVTRYTLYNKLNGSSDFTAREIKSIADTLHLTRDEVDRIFFAEESE